MILVLFFIIVIAPLLSKFVLAVLLFDNVFVLFMLISPLRVFPFVVSIA